MADCVRPRRWSRKASERDENALGQSMAEVM